jgi:hypothetical protein
MPRTEEGKATRKAECKRKLFLVMIPAVNANKLSLRIHHILNRSTVIVILSIPIAETVAFSLVEHYG